MESKREVLELRIGVGDRVPCQFQGSFEARCISVVALAGGVLAEPLTVIFREIAIPEEVAYNQTNQPLRQHRCHLFLDHSADPDASWFETYLETFTVVRHPRSKNGLAYTRWLRHWVRSVEHYAGNREWSTAVPDGVPTVEEVCGHIRWMLQDMARDELMEWVQKMRIVD